MKKILFLACLVALFTTSCESNDGGDKPKTAVCTFEGADFDALVDNPQYNGKLLYGDGTYAWYDEGTDLYGGLTNSYGDGKFWGGGTAVSSYFSTDLEANHDFNTQLTVYSTKAHSGKNCIVCNGYKSDYGDCRPCIQFAGNTGKGKGIIDHLYICPTCYSFYSATQGDNFVQPIGENGFVKIIATGYDANQTEIGSIETYLYKGTPTTAAWTKWSLRELGEVTYIKFDMNDGKATILQPAYFAIDDIAISISK